MLSPNQCAADAVEDIINSSDRSEAMPLPWPVEAFWAAIVGASSGAARVGGCLGDLLWIDRFLDLCRNAERCVHSRGLSIYSVQSVDGSGAVRLLLP
jgi:hypothetical protein